MRVTQPFHRSGAYHPSCHFGFNWMADNTTRGYKWDPSGNLAPRTQNNVYIQKTKLNLDNYYSLKFGDLRSPTREMRALQDEIKSSSPLN